MRVKADLWRHKKSSSYLALLKSSFLDRTFRPVFTLRLCQFLNSNGRALKLLLPVGKVCHRIACSAAAIDLPWETRIGAGLKITHGWALVVNGNAQIGENVTLMHGVTIGGRAGGYPVIENDVFVGPHAVILGGVTIGKGCVIQSGSVVIRDISPHTMVGPATLRTLKENCVAEVPNRFSYEKL